MHTQAHSNMSLALDIHNGAVEVAENIIYVGVYIDKSLDWKNMPKKV